MLEKNKNNMQKNSIFITDASFIPTLEKYNEIKISLGDRMLDIRCSIWYI